MCQIDACRVGGVNEVLAIILMAAKFGVPVCPHAGGVGLCEYVQHLAVFDYVSVSCSLNDRVIEWVDHLHEHFRHPGSSRGAATEYSLDPATASRSAARVASREYSFPHGPVSAAAFKAAATLRRKSLPP